MFENCFILHFEKINLEGSEQSWTDLTWAWVPFPKRRWPPGCSWSGSGTGPARTLGRWGTRGSPGLGTPNLKNRLLKDAFKKIEWYKMHLWRIDWLKMSFIFPLRLACRYLKQINQSRAKLTPMTDWIPNWSSPRKLYSVLPSAPLSSLPPSLPRSSASLHANVCVGVPEGRGTGTLRFEGERGRRKR